MDEADRVVEILAERNFPTGSRQEASERVGVIYVPGGRREFPRQTEFSRASKRHFFLACSEVKIEVTLRRGVVNHLLEVRKPVLPRAAT